MSSRARRASRSQVWLAGAMALACRTASEAPARPDGAIPGVTVDAPCVERRCGEGLMCRASEAGSKADGGASDRCVLEPGRCRDDWDCARAIQRCRRFGTRLGVCQDRGI